MVQPAHTHTPTYGCQKQVKEKGEKAPRVRGSLWQVAAVFVGGTMNDRCNFLGENAFCQAN